MSKKCEKCVIIVVGDNVGLFDDLFGNDKKKSQQAFGLFSFMNEQQKDNNSEYTDEELDNYGLEDV